MVNYAILLLLAAVLSLLATAGSLGVILHHASRRVRQVPARTPIQQHPGDSTIPYAPAECSPPLLIRHPWIAALLCGITGVLPLATIASLPWRYLPAPLQPAAIAGMAIYTILLLILLIRGCSGFDQPAACRWSRGSLFLACAALLFITAGTVWVMDLRVKERIATQEHRFQEYQAGLRAEPAEGPAAVDLYMEANSVPIIPRGPRPDTFTTRLVDYPPEAEPMRALIHQAAQCTRLGETAMPSKGNRATSSFKASAITMHARHATWAAQQGDWPAAIEDLNDLHALARLGTARGDWFGQCFARTCVDVAANLTQTLINEARTPRQLSAIRLPDHAWYQTLIEKDADWMAAELPTLASNPTVVPELGPGPWWRAMLYRVICYDDELQTATANAQQLLEISRACAGMRSAGGAGSGPLAVGFPPPVPPAPLSVYMGEAAAAGPENLASSINLRVKRDLLELAIACRRFHMRNGRLPGSLQEVVEAGLLEELPMDHWDGAPLRFRLANGILTLISTNRSIAAGNEITVSIDSDPRRPIPIEPAVSAAAARILATRPAR